ncbi:MAG: hypothetical protein M3Y86_13620, partial [Verrucomicrobiota bacterium]|nr:hypothetical protein [Verrucomicrobiota bacterium]
MLLLAGESIVGGIADRSLGTPHAELWQTSWLQLKTLLPGVWLCFSLSYSRGNYREFLYRSRFLILAIFLLPITLALVYRAGLIELIPSDNGDGWLASYSVPAKILSGLLLAGALLILMNLERTFRAAVGTMQWRVKFVVLGLGLIFGARIYTLSQALLYSHEPLASVGIESGALLLGCVFIAVGYLRGGFGEIDIYPSRAALHTSITVLFAGVYLFVVGILAQIAARTRIATNFQLQALVILVAVAVLAVLLLSNQVRQAIERFISRHFKRPEHD